jgi:hypothetical protein
MHESDGVGNFGFVWRYNHRVSEAGMGDSIPAFLLSMKSVLEYLLTTNNKFAIIDLPFSTKIDKIQQKEVCDQLRTSSIPVGSTP